MSYSKYDTIGRLNTTADIADPIFKVGDEVAVIVGDDVKYISTVASIKGGKVKLSDFDENHPILYSAFTGRHTKKTYSRESIRLTTFGDADAAARNTLAERLQYASFAAAASLADLEEVAALLKLKGIEF